MTCVRSLSPDNRLDYHDPDMPCIRIAEDCRGQLSTEVIPAAEVQAEALKDLTLADPKVFPKYRGDPSYYWCLEASTKRVEKRLVGFSPEARECYEEGCSEPAVCIVAGCKQHPKDAG